MKRSVDRILTTHVGSIPRPPELLELGGTATGEPVDQAEYDRRLAAAIADVVRRQVEVGIDVVNDGEFGKSSWASYILERITGFEHRPNDRRVPEWIGADAERFPEHMKIAFPGAIDGMPVDACIGPIEYRGQDAIGRAIADLKAAIAITPPLEAFMTAVAPASSAYDGIDEYYANERDYVFAIADALREEYLAIHEAGLVIQVDDAVLANMYDALVRKSPEKYRQWAELRIDALNYALEGIPEDRVRYHICFGSWHVPHTSDAPLEKIVDLILRVNAGAYSIEAANPRHEHEWRVWERVKLPNDRILIPGVVTHHTVTVEHPQLVADRLVRFARLVGRENLIAGSDCGFAQVDWVQRTHPKIMWAKYELLVEGARIASKLLWG
ncbi:epoxyalkane--coenzyme M transferase [Sphingomonas sp. MMS24-J13]|uniref:epoxyalkane--coenzyme M transferase n=1 Tax=Sphingomonas sp. MMS24-J13 TaxID=3238686 RepID=UPI00384D77B1